MKQQKQYDDPARFEFSSDSGTLLVSGVNDRHAVILSVPPEVDGVPVTGVGNGAFFGLPDVKKIIIPDRVRFVENNAFKNCPNLKIVELSADLNSIGAMAFAGCPELKEITISCHTHRFDVNSFKGCRNLRSVYAKCPDRIRHFVVAPESDESLWLYLRAVNSACDPHGGYMDKYDATFLEITDETDKFYIAVDRLKNPEDLPDNMKRVYRKALSGMIHDIIASDRVDRLTVIGELGCIDDEDLAAHMDFAGRIGGRCIAYLLEYRRRSGMLKPYDFTL